MKRIACPNFIRRLYIAAFFIGVIVPQVVAAVGITPGRIYADTLEVGESVDLQVILVSPAATEDQVFEIKPQGDVADIVSFDATEAIIPAGEQRVTVPFTVTAVTSTPLREILLMFLSTDLEKNSGGNQVQYGVAARLFIATSDVYTPPRGREIAPAQYPSPEPVANPEAVYENDIGTLSDAESVDEQGVDVVYQENRIIGLFDHITTLHIIIVGITLIAIIYAILYLIHHHEEL